MTTAAFTAQAKEIKISAGSKVTLTPDQETTVVCEAGFDLKKVKNICTCMFESVPGSHAGATKEYISYLYHGKLMIRLKNKIVERGASFDECTKAAYTEFSKLCLESK